MNVTAEIGWQVKVPVLEHGHLLFSEVAIEVTELEEHVQIGRPHRVSPNSRFSFRGEQQNRAIHLGSYIVQFFKQCFSWCAGRFRGVGVSFRGRERGVFTFHGLVRGRAGS